MSLLENVKKNSNHPDHDLGEHWYDSIKLGESVSKKGKKNNTSAFNTLAEEYFTTYLSLAEAAQSCDRQSKIKKSSVYVEGLLKNGGPSTDIFLRAWDAKKLKSCSEKFYSA